MWRLDWLGHTVSLVKFPTSVGMVPVRAFSCTCSIPTQIVNLTGLMDSSQMPAAVALAVWLCHFYL